MDQLHYTLTFLHSRVCLLLNVDSQRQCTCYQSSYRGWKVLKLKCWDFQSWKRHRSWKTLEKSRNSKVVVLGSLQYINTTTGIAFGLIYCNAVISKTDLVCALFDLVQPCLWTDCILKSPWKRVFWILETPRICLCKSWKTVFLMSVRTLCYVTNWV